jgi:hypothetical protein
MKYSVSLSELVKGWDKIPITGVDDADTMATLQQSPTIKEEILRIMVDNGYCGCFRSCGIIMIEITSSSDQQIS